MTKNQATMTKLATALKLAFCSLMLCTAAQGQNWNRATTSTNLWLSMAGSLHGNTLVAADFTDDTNLYSVPGHIYASTNGGQTWQLTSAPDNYWISVAASTNGLRLVAGAEYNSDYFPNPGQIFISTNGGLTWTNTAAPSNFWQAVASSADGRILAGAAYGDGIYVSTNFGTDWKINITDHGWNNLAMSADGQKMYATSGEGVYVSTNTGSSWNLASNSPPLCFSVVCSADGSQVFAGIVGAAYDSDYLGIYNSTNYGATWSQTSAPISDVQNYQCLSLSTYGDVLLAGAFSSENHGLVYLSNDGGATWIPQTAPTNSWGCVFCSADGTMLSAGEYGGAIYNAANPVKAPALAISAKANQTVLSWPLFPAGFQLQTTSTLNPGATWTNSASAEIISGTNNFSTNNLGSPVGFFRLARP